ncbi:MAG TPA: DUF1097 domain-containing protein [Candidatus Binataceae bacterium]|nr:DUF1097 domain-containing protein [Candidatus Binataceae bacterium]
MQKNPIPMEWFIAILAALTVPLSVYAKLPMWATYVTWAGAFLVGPNEAIRKLYPTLIVGTVSGVIFFTLAFTLDPIVGSVALTNSVLVFAMTLGLLYLARIPAFALVPGIFFGFTCYVGVALAAQASTISALFAPWIYATIALLLGPPLAWISVAPYLPREVQPSAESVVVPAENLTQPS